MTGIDVRALPSLSSLLSIDSLGHGDASGLLISRYDTTNTVSYFPVSSAAQPLRTRVTRTIEYAISKHEELLRKLAD